MMQDKLRKLKEKEMIVGLDVENKKMKCGQCMNEIKSKYHRLDQYGKIFCQPCYSNSRRCEVCGIPTQESFLVKNWKVCVDCYSQKYRCKSCSRNLKNEEFHTIPGLQGFFCSSCNNSKIKCSRCGFPAYTNDTFILLENNIYYCEFCQDRSVLTEEVGSNILFNISNIFYQRMGLQMVKNISLSLATKREIQNGYDDLITTLSTSEEQSKSEYYPSFVKHKDNHYELFVLNGLPLSTFIAIATYEYAQIWQSKYSPRRVGRILWEGFADWTAVKLLSLLGYHEEIHRIESRVDDFVFGLKKIQLIEKSKGTQGVVELITQTK